MKTNELSSGIKNAADIVRKGDNLELYAMLLDLYAKSLELQDENKELKEKLSEKSSIDSLRNRIIRHEQPFITLKEDDTQIYYCAHCWDSKEKLIQVSTEARSATFICPSCKNEGVYDKETHNRFEEARRYKGPRYSII